MPDATVLSAGGVEYSPKNDGVPKAAADTHKNAQIFTPPYLFRPDGRRADRPDVTGAPADVTYGQTFTVGTSHPDQVGQVDLVRLSSVTHSFNSNQRINKLTFTAGAASLAEAAPVDPKLGPPGHYMLFVLNKAGVPSVAPVIKFHP